MSIIFKSFKKSLGADIPKHLKTFYLVLPALMAKDVEHSCQGKEHISKRNSLGGFIADEGFALGTAFLLALL